MTYGRNTFPKVRKGTPIFLRKKIRDGRTGLQWSDIKHEIINKDHLYCVQKHLSTLTHNLNYYKKRKLQCF